MVVGGGLAGSAAATLLACGGREVLLLEKSREAHHKVCGEFLSREALHYLPKLGVDADALGAVPIRRVRLAAREMLAETELPFVARSLTRRCLDEALLAGAVQAGVTVRRGAAVQKIGRVQDGWLAGLDDSSSVGAAHLFAGSGKHDLRGQARPEGTQPDLLAFKMYFQLAPQQAAELRHSVELVLFPGGYLGLQPVEAGLANLCLLVGKTAWQRLGRTWQNLLQHMQQASPHLARRLAGAVPQLARPLAVSPIPYGWIRRETEDGLWWIGDQAAVIPSFSGDGMSIALHSACLAAELCLGGEGAPIYQRRLHAQLKMQVRIATAISRMLVAVPSVARLASLAPGLMRGIAGTTRIHADLL